MRPRATYCTKDPLVFSILWTILSLTLLQKSGKLIENNTNQINAMTKTSTRPPFFFQRTAVRCKAARRIAPNSFPSGSAETISRRRRVRPILRYGLLGSDEAAFCGKLRWYHGVKLVLCLYAGDFFCTL